MSVRYPVPWGLLSRLVLAILRRERRAFSKDAQACVPRLRPPLQVCGSENIPSTGPFLLTVNHYTRPGFQAWWLALAISATVPAEVNWVVTSEWTYPDRFRKRFVTPATRWVFHKVAAIYGFTPMPPMPPDPGQVVARAQAVRQVLAYVRREQNPVIGLAPEGRDFESGKLGIPPPGAGRFIFHLSKLGLNILPVGAHESGEGFYLRFGPPYTLDVPNDLPSSQSDQLVSRIVMDKIAKLLPSHLLDEIVEAYP